MSASQSAVRSRAEAVQVSRTLDWMILFTLFTAVLGGYLHLNPTTGCQISTLIYFFFGSGPFKYQMKNWQLAAMSPQ
jgi:hypothetical protein